MVDERFVAYFKRWKDKGYSEEQIKIFLLKQGHPVNVIEEAAVASRTAPTPIVTSHLPIPNRYRKTLTVALVFLTIFAVIAVAYFIVQKDLNFLGSDNETLTIFSNDTEDVSDEIFPVLETTTLNTTTPDNSSKDIPPNNVGIIYSGSGGSGGGGGGSSGGGSGGGGGGNGDSGPTPTCSDGQQNGAETGVDCGGSCTACAQARVYYVSNSLGNDSNDGLTQSTPWQTLQYAEEHATSPGNVIALKKGDVWLLDNVLEINNGGSAGKYITWDGGLWGTGAKAIIRANSDGGNNPKWFSLVHIAACKYLIMQNIIFDGKGYERNGLVIGGYEQMYGPTAQNNEEYIIIQDCSILNMGNGLYTIGLLAQAYYTDMNNIIIRRNVIDNISNHGIAFYMNRFSEDWYTLHNGYIGYNTITNCGGKAGNDGPANSIFLNNDLDSVIIERNTIIEGGGASTGIAIAAAESVAGEAPRNIVIRYNKAIMNYSNALGFYYGDDQSADVYGNLFYVAHAGWGGAVTILYDDYTGAKFNFYNNVMVVEGNDTSKCFVNDMSTGTVTFKNNILIHTGDSPGCNFLLATSGPITHSNNFYYRTFVGSGLYVTDMGVNINRDDVATWEPSAIISDPLLVDREGFDWHLQTGSPAIGKGVNIPGITKDYDDRSYANPPSLGAFEYVP
jgi:hypothetical protein